MASLLDSLLLKVKNRRMVMLLTPVIAGTLIGTLMVVRPGLSKIAAIRNQKKALSTKVSAFNDIVAQEKKLSDFKTRLSLIENKAKAIEELSNLATVSGLNISSIVPDEKRTVGRYAESILVRIDAEGNCHQLGEFVSRIEGLQSFSRIMLYPILRSHTHNHILFSSQIRVSIT